MKNYLTLSHADYMSTFTAQMRANHAANEASETLISGAVVLYWQHNCNVAYLNHALQFARGRRGVRVNAVRAFLEHFTGAVFKNNAFTKAGRRVKWLTAEFDKLDSWIDWANDKAPEPQYNFEKAQLKVIDMLKREAEKAKEHGHDEYADELIHESLKLAMMTKKSIKAVA